MRPTRKSPFSIASSSICEDDDLIHDFPCYHDFTIGRAVFDERGYLGDFENTRAHESPRKAPKPPKCQALAAARAAPSPPPMVPLPSLPSPPVELQTVPYHLTRSHVSGPPESLPVEPREGSDGDIDEREPTSRSSSLGHQVSSKIRGVDWHGFFQQGSLRRTDATTYSVNLSTTAVKNINFPAPKPSSRLFGMFNHMLRSSSKANDSNKRHSKPLLWFQNANTVDRLALTQLPPF
jgi:hypothetical protein